MKKFSAHLTEQRDADLDNYVRNDGAGIHRIQARYNELVRQYPHDGGVLYRGMNFRSPAHYLSFLRSVRGRVMTLSIVSSWSTDIEVARDFAKHRKAYNLSFDVMQAWRDQSNTGERIMGFVGVIVKIVVPPHSGIDMTKSDIGSEAEVILGPGTYKIDDIIVEKRFANLIKGAEYNEKVQHWIDSDLAMTPDVQWILKNKKTEIVHSVIDQLNVKANRNISRIKVHVERHAPYRLFRNVSMYPGQEVKVWIEYDSMYHDALNLLDQPSPTIPRQISTSIARKLETSIKSVYHHGDKIILEHPTIPVLKIVHVSAVDVPILRIYTRQSYIDYNAKLTELSKSDKISMSSAVYELRDDLNSFMQIASL